MRTVYVNGSYVAEEDAKISVFDRGFLFADSIYEVTSVVDGHLMDFPRHMERLKRSMSELDMDTDISADFLYDIHQQLITKNNLTEGVIYIQITRGCADRDFDFSTHDAAPGIVLFTQQKKLIENPLAKRGQKIALAEDLRWGRSDIKTTQLLYSSLTKTRAKKKGADDVWLHLDEMITEGSSNNAYIVTEAKQIITRELSTDILHGITRRSVLEVASQLNMEVIERAFSVTELKAAKEAFTTSSSGFVNPVVQVEDTVIGDGTPGEVTTALRENYIKAQLNSCEDTK